MKLILDKTLQQKILIINPNSIPNATELYLRKNKEKNTTKVIILHN